MIFEITEIKIGQLNGKILPMDLVILHCNKTSPPVSEKEKTLLLFRHDDELLECSLIFHNDNSKNWHAMSGVARDNHASARLRSRTRFAAISPLFFSYMMPFSLLPLSKLSNPIPRLLSHRSASPIFQTELHISAFRSELSFFCLARRVGLRWPSTVEGVVSRR